ncbi:MAG TPA: hypothetical protein VEU96_21255 [Bryobacteraceae bacterium]|nr:hypothetical protein [Bryobacteraceae bacterium]
MSAVAIAVSAAAQPDSWVPVRVFEGKWEGPITGKPGKQFSSREYRFELGGKFLSQRDKSVYEDAKSGAREDFGFFSYDTNQKKIVWRQFHSEGFVNEYTLDLVSTDGKSLEFVTTRIENLPQGFRAKKGYRFLSADEIVETFSLAPPGKDFEVFTVAHLKRVK